MNANLASRFKVDTGVGFQLKKFNPSATPGVKSKDEGVELLQQNITKLPELQEKLFADDHWSLLLIFQGMDASGKDSAISHVMSGVNPQGCEVHSFKAPTSNELDHDFMWRTTVKLPERGRIGIFNRSYYEEVLIVRVHPEILAGQKIPAALKTKKIWDERFEDINAFERFISRNGIAVRKFFMNVSKDEQRKRFLARVDEPEKNWKFSAVDVQERQHWNKYMDAYEQMIRATATKHAPWIVVPADHKWYARAVVSQTVLEALESLNLQYPRVDANRRREILELRKSLLKKDRK